VQEGCPNANGWTSIHSERDRTHTNMPEKKTVKSQPEYIFQGRTKEMK